MDENKLLDLKFSQTNTVQGCNFTGYVGSISAQFHQKFCAVTHSKAFSVMPVQ